MPKYTERLLEDLRARWPVPREVEYRNKIMLHRAFRNSDKDILRPTGWSKDTDEHREYIIDPLGERIPGVWSDLLFGVDPVIAPAAKADSTRMSDLIDINDLPSEWQRAEDICSTEGEVWYRVVPDMAVEHASIEWHSRLQVLPLWVGKHLMAAAFVSVLDRDKQSVWRYVEVHEKGSVRRLLFKGSANSDSLGQEMELSAHAATRDWEATWDHGLEMLAGRVYNKLGADVRYGVSDYDGIEDLLLALNEITTIGQENARLTAKQRAIIPQRFLNMAGNFPRGAEILIATEVDQDPEKIRNQVAMVEFEFDAAALIAYTEHLTDRVLTRARIAPQLVGRHTEGAQTGPALRARILDSELAAQGKGKQWDDQNPRILLKAAQVEALPQDQGGLGIKWSDTKKLPSFKRAPSLPEDPEALTRRLAVAVNAEMLSRKTSIGLSFPEWDSRRVDEEIQQIQQEVGNDAPPPTGSTGEKNPNLNAETATGRQERRDGPNGASRGGRSA